MADNGRALSDAPERLSYLKFQQLGTFREGLGLSLRIDA